MHLFMRSFLSVWQNKNKKLKEKKTYNETFEYFSYTVLLPKTISYSSMDRFVVLSTSTGLVRGVVRHSSDGLSFLSFRGIPYAEAPVGDLRFRPPQAKHPWQGIADALKCGPDCPQYNPLTRFFRAVYGQWIVSVIVDEQASFSLFSSGRLWAMKTIASL